MRARSSWRRLACVFGVLFATFQGGAQSPPRIALRSGGIAAVVFDEAVAVSECSPGLTVRALPGETGHLFAVSGTVAKEGSIVFRTKDSAPLVISVVAAGAEEPPSRTVRIPRRPPGAGLEVSAAIGGSTIELKIGREADGSGYMETGKKRWPVADAETPTVAEHGLSLSIPMATMGKAPASDPSEVGKSSVRNFPEKEALRKEAGSEKLLRPAKLPIAEEGQASAPGMLTSSRKESVENLLAGPFPTISSAPPEPPPKPVEPLPQVPSPQGKAAKPGRKPAAESDSSHPSPTPSSEPLRNTAGRQTGPSKPGTPSEPPAKKAEPVRPIVFDLRTDGTCISIRVTSGPPIVLEQVTGTISTVSGSGITGKARLAPEPDGILPKPLKPGESVTLRFSRRTQGAAFRLVFRREDGSLSEVEMGKT